MSFINYIRKFLFMSPAYNTDDARLNGSVLFPDDYTDPNKVKILKTLFLHENYNVHIRIPIPIDSSNLQKALKLCNICVSVGIQPIALFDHYSSNDSMITRINQVATISPGVKFFEIFNELPACEYSGEQIIGNDLLVRKINAYSDIIKTRIPDAKTISMASKNILQVEDLPSAWGGDNFKQQQFVVENSTTDYTAIHLYCGSWEQERAIWNVIDAMDSWLGTKPLIITETGINDPDEHTTFYNKWCSIFSKYLEPTSILWYRQSIKNTDLADAGFALESETGWLSPLYEKFIEN